ncbi:MAG: polysaccharide deacetylase family protein [Sphingobacteriaceae bacterium]
MILLSFDIEEFDMPLEYHTDISFDDQIHISIEGTTRILDLLKKHQIKATFFSTVVFAENAPELIKRIINEGHELASHTYYHSHFENDHILQSKLRLEELSGAKILGFRMPRMQPVNNQLLAVAGYTYNSSLNPTYLPGRYNHFTEKRTYFTKESVLQIPASVSPKLRIPLFWIAFHNLPLKIYQYLCTKTFQKDGYLNLYFHPWEFTNLCNKKRFGLPSYVSKNSGVKMENRMDTFITNMKAKKYPFGTFGNFIKTIS